MNNKKIIVSNKEAPTKAICGDKNPLTGLRLRQGCDGKCSHISCHYFHRSLPSSGGLRRYRIYIYTISPNCLWNGTAIMAMDKAFIAAGLSIFC